MSQIGLLNRKSRGSGRTDGTGSGTVQSQISTSVMKFLEGTFCARILFSDAPDTGGDDGDRSYVQQVDWVYHAKDVALTPAQARSHVAALRSMEIGRKDTVPDP